MISTVTTTVSSIAISNLAQVFATLTVLLFLALLIQKEVVRENTDNQILLRLNRAIDILLIPLGMATVAILVVALAGAL